MSELTLAPGWYSARAELILRSSLKEALKRDRDQQMQKDKHWSCRCYTVDAWVQQLSEQSIRNLHLHIQQFRPLFP